jgi:hypothetical protein
VLRGIFEPKGKKVTEQRKWHNKAIHYLYSSPNTALKSRMEWTEHAAHTGQISTAYKTLIKKPNGKSSIGRKKHMGR